MSKRGPRPIVFVCIGMDSVKNEFVSKVIQAASQGEAASLFLDQTKVKAETIHGPFRPKKMQVLETTRTLKFSNQIQRAQYDNWTVMAHFLKEPENHAYLVFIKRVDDKKVPMPKGTIIVPVSDLRIYDK